MYAKNVKDNARPETGGDTNRITRARTICTYPKSRVARAQRRAAEPPRRIGATAVGPLFAIDATTALARPPIPLE